jgi:hypothetical protein
MAITCEERANKLRPISGILSDGKMIAWSLFSQLAQEVKQIFLRLPAGVSSGHA